jgi:beta-glucosidase
MKTWSITLFLFCPVILCAQDYRTYPMWDTALPFETRILDLLGRLTLQEKVGQMMHAAPAVPSLGIPGYNWWNEALHGVARSPFPVTVFPQAIALAATWDTIALHTMADITATEGRAVHRKALSLGLGHRSYMGLTYWSPNINIFRDPRWGRGQETYGEDPFLTASMGTAFVNGLQGNDPKYLKAAACAKHFAVHSGPEPSRHSDNIIPDAPDLWDTYLPAFKALVVQAQVAGVMCAYNAVYGQPCCASDLLMQDLLRGQWGFKGYVTSDCWGIDDFFSFHKTHASRASAAIDALIHTTDLECGNAVYTALQDAVKQGSLPEAQLDSALFRLFLIRFRLGMFDPPERVPFAQIPDTALNLPRHRAHALEMARKSIVLLKNEKETLPLSRKVRKIAVLGPNADNDFSALGNYHGIPDSIATVLEGIREKLGPEVEVWYDPAVSFTNDTLFVASELQGRFSWDSRPGFYAEYYSNPSLSGDPLFSGMEAMPDRVWHEGAFLHGKVFAENFSARYAALFTADSDTILSFLLEADDGCILRVEGKTIVDAWNRPGLYPFSLAVEAGKSYQWELEYRQGGGRGILRLQSGAYSRRRMEDFAPHLQDADAIVFVGGISPQLEGEALQVSVPGFLGGDRTHIALPAAQTAFLKSLHGMGKPVVLVLMSGSALSIPWEDEHLPAILQAWYGGQSAGTALADVLFGDYNPAGRLPFTVYRGDEDLPAFKDYRMEGRTYRFFRGQPLYPFGYGLSYSSFRYKSLRLPARIKVGMPLHLKVQVENTGRYPGEEVAQVYISLPASPYRAPILALKGFQRFFLAPGESKTLEFTIPPEQLTLPDVSGSPFFPGGKAMVRVGGGQKGMHRSIVMKE